MSDSILQVNQIKDKGGNATGITIADSSANVTIGNLTASGGNLGTITQRSASSSGITFTRSSGTAIDSTVLGNLYGTTNVKPNDSSSTTHAWLRFSYTTAVKVTKLQWLQVDGGGAGSTVNNHLSFEGSNVASPDAGAGHSDWQILSSFSKSIHKAVGTSATIGLLISFPGFLIYTITGYNIDGIPNYSLGYVNIIIVLSISITSIFTAPIGAKLSTKFNNKALKKIFAVFLLMTCISLFINHFF